MARQWSAKPSTAVRIRSEPQKKPNTKCWAFYLDLMCCLIGCNFKFDDKIFYSKNEFNKEITLVNFFSTWCGPCLAEHNYLLRIANEKKIKIIGINYKDNNKKTIEWLNELGNPYTSVLIDSNGRLGINWGVYGIPETYIIDSNGLIKYRLVGPINKKNYKSFIKKIVSIEK